VTHPGDVIEKIVQGEPISIRLSPEGIALQETVHPEKQHSLQFRSQEDWLYIEKINRRPVIHIIGGGHVSLAFSELMSHLGFYCKVYDDRPALNTLVQNSFANEKFIIPGYEQLGEYIGEGTDELAVIMTIGYRTDKLALKQLLDKGFFYLGMLGSEKKVETIFSELRSEGVQEELLKKVFAPVGIFINSKTPREIAVSIAAEIIRERNR
jgi:xanthine dehydrogenase accessory factor